MRRKIVLFFLISLSLSLFSPVKIAYSQTTTANFEVESYTEVDHGKADFSTHGNPPYINGTIGDWPTNDINTGNLNREMADFEFEKLPIPEARATIEVTNVIFHQNSSNQGAGGSVSHIGFNFYNGSDWYGNGGSEERFKIRLPLGAWNTTSINIGILWSSFNESGRIPAVEFNSFKLWVQSVTTWTGSPTVELDYAYLTVTYVRTGFTHFPIRLAFGLVGIVLMIISPSLTVRAVYQNRDYEFIIIGIMLFMAGYVFTICWLIP